MNGEQEMKDRDTMIIRELAKRFAEITNSPEMGQRRQRWYSHNDLQEGRPMVLCYPEGSWPELINEKELRCEGEETRIIEHSLRQKIYWHDVIRDDAAQESVLYVYPAVDLGNFGVATEYVFGENRGSYRWEHPIKNLDSDLAKLKMPEPTHDRRETERRMDAAHGLVGGILDVKLRPGLDYWTLGMTTDVIRLIGLENLFLYMYDNPHGLHRLMAFMRDAKEKTLEWYESESGLVQPNDKDGYTGSGGMAYTRSFRTDTKGPLMQAWGFAESQETVGVSPQMFGEFIFPYQLPLLNRFGLNCYGCCEPIHERLKYIMQLPRLRRVSISPWCDQAKAAEALQRNAVFSRKPNPAFICAGFNEDAARADVAGTLKAAHGCNIELIMKDTHTLQHEPWRISRWVQIAKEEIEKAFH
jgi:hypothetical protein